MTALQGSGPFDTEPGADAMGIRWQRHLALGTTAIAFAAVVPIIAAVALARPWLVGLAAVPLVALATEVAAAAPPKLMMATSVNSRSVTEGDIVTVTVSVTASARGVLYVRPSRTGGIVGTDESLAVELLAHRPTDVELHSQAASWGRGSVGLERLEWRTPLGLASWRGSIRSLETVWVLPRPMGLRSRLGVSRTTPRTGPHRSRVRGDGVEYHSSRPYEIGDRWKDLDHRVMARTGDPWTKTRHADRSRDLVVVVDLIDDGTDATKGPAMADLSLRAAAGIVERHLADRDRVGVVILGARYTAVPPRDGRRQGHVILDRLMRAEGREPARLATRHVDLRKRIPAGATVVVISPLFDSEIREQIHSLRRHGRDVAVLQVGHDIVERRRDELNPDDRRAADLHRLHAEAVRTALRADRIPVQAWGLDEPVEEAVEAMQLLHGAMLRRPR